MRISKILAAAVLALGLMACSDTLTGPEAVEEMQKQIHFPPSDISNVTVNGDGTAIVHVLSLYAPAGIVPIAEAKIVGAPASLQMEASVTFSSRSDVVCEQGVCRAAWVMYANLKTKGTGDADVVISLKANPLETTKFRVTVRPSCYDEEGNYTCKG